MRILGLEEFLAMPEGTVYAKYEPCVFEGLQIKGNSLPAIRDFCYQDFISIGGESATDSDELIRCQENGEPIPMDLHIQGRDGCFNEDQLFAVYERGDVELLIARLQEALVDSQ